jgi:hypothetical protein
MKVIRPGDGRRGWARRFTCTGRGNGGGCRAVLGAGPRPGVTGTIGMDNHIRIVVGRIRLSDHPSDPRLQVGRVLGRQVVVGRHYAEGQLGLYVPAGIVVPESFLREMWLWNDRQGKGRLAGSRGDRVKAKVMGGVLSEGLFYGSTWYDEAGVWHRSLLWRDEWAEGDDVTDLVGT